MRINRNNTSLFMLLLALLAGCKKEEAPAPAPPPPKSPPAAPVAKPAPPVQLQLSSAAKAGGGLDFRKKTDPFKPAIAPPPAAAVQPGGRPVGTPPADQLPIQSFEVSKFKVAGIIAGLKENRALVIDPTGKGYVVQVGMQIGNANGRISRITPTAVEVVERFRENGGRTKSRTVVLTLPKKR